MRGLRFIISYLGAQYAGNPVRNNVILTQVNTAPTTGPIMISTVEDSSCMGSVVPTTGYPDGDILITPREMP